MDVLQNSAFELKFFWLSFLAYSFASALYVIYLGLEKKKVSVVATAFMGAGLVFQTLALALRSYHLHRLPLTNMFEFLSIFAWFAVIFYFLALKIYRWQILGAFISLTVFMLMVACSLLPKHGEMQLVPALQSYWLQIHVSVAALGEAVFAVSFAVNIMYFIKRKVSEESKLGKRLPDLETLDHVSYKAVTVGYPLFTVGALFAGAIWAEQAWGIFWSWDPKEVGSLVVWLIYSAYLHARYVKGWKGMRAAVLSSFGFICTLLTFFANMFLGGLHAYG
jgi:cytochrome c-type biogenesis protein CcsB